MTIDELEEFFKNAKLPENIKLDEAEIIMNVPLFIESHLFHVKTYGNNPTFRGYYDRLVKLHGILTDGEAKPPIP